MNLFEGVFYADIISFPKVKPIVQSKIRCYPWRNDERKFEQWCDGKQVIRFRWNATTQRNGLYAQSG